MKNEVKITTTEKFENAEIIEYLNPIIAHVVIGMNIFKDFLAGITDIVGGNSNTFENTLENANNDVLNKLVQKAKDIGANCILNLRIENNEISSKDKSMLMVTAIGTAAICDFNEIQNSKNIKAYRQNLADNFIKLQDEEKIQKEKQNEFLVEKYNILFNNNHYHLGNYKYTKLEDAVNYAKFLENKK